MPGTTWTSSFNLPYDEDGNPAHTMDVLHPADPGTVPRPAVIWVHGGGWAGGTRQPNFDAALATRGFATFAISYRFSQEAIFPAQIDDVQSAIRFVRANATRLGVDPDRIGIWGHSAGGHLAALAGVYGDRTSREVTAAVQAVAPLAGPSDFRGGRTDDPEILGNDKPLQRMLGKPDDGTADAGFLDRAELASPVAHLEGAIPPYLIAHGDADNVVDIRESRQLAEAIHAAGGKADFVVASGIAHDREGLLACKDSTGTSILERVIAHFETHLGAAGHR